MHSTQNIQSAENFLETLYRGSFTPTMSNSSSLPEEVSFPANLGLIRAPIPSHNRFLSAALSRVENPTFDRVRFRQWAFEFPCFNWALATDNVAVFEYNAAIRPEPQNPMGACVKMKAMKCPKVHEEAIEGLYVAFSGYALPEDTMPCASCHDLVANDLQHGAPLRYLQWNRCPIDWRYECVSLHAEWQ